MAPGRNIEEMKVDELKKRCKQIGLPTSGNKQQLIDRLEEYYSEEHFSSFTNGSQLLDRVHALEKSLVELRDKGFYPAIVSSPKATTTKNIDVQATCTNVFSPISSITHVTQPQVNDNVHPTVTFSLPCSLESPTTLVYSTSGQPYNPISCVSATQTSNSTTCASRVQPYNPLTNVATTQPYNPISCVSTTQAYNPTTCAPSAQPYNPIASVFTTQPYNSTTTQTYHPTTRVFTTQPYTPTTTQTYNPPTNAAFMAPTCNSPFTAPPPTQPIRYSSYNPYNNVHEIIGLLPDFNPSVEISLNSQQFIRRIES